MNTPEFDSTDITTNVMDEICKGCLLYEQHIEDPLKYLTCNGYNKGDMYCPCQNCLVKTMCNEHCELIRKRSWTIFNRPWEDDKWATI